MLSRPGERLQIRCSHNIQDYTRVLWYSQSNNTRLQPLGYMNVNDGYPEAGVAVQIEGRATKDQNCTLTIENLELKHSGVYFCAASDTMLHISAAAYKNLLTLMSVLGADDVLKLQ